MRSAPLQIALFWAAACANDSGASADGLARGAAVADSAEAIESTSVEDVVTRLIDGEPLRRASLAAGHREVRLWMDAGARIPHRLLRIIQSPDTVAGELVYWLSEPPQIEADSAFAELYHGLLALAGRSVRILRASADGVWTAESDCIGVPWLIHYRITGSVGMRMRQPRRY